MVKIGNIELRSKPLFLAPMEDITDPSFRYMCKKFGADFMYTEFISSDGLIRDGRKSVQKLNIHDYERPIGIQIYGHLIDSMVKAAQMAERSNPELIDINFGCPVKKIAKRGAGAGMIRDIPQMVKMTEAVVKNTKLPVTVKTRLGWDEENKNIVEITERLQDVGISAISIHARTRSQLYKGEADWSLIGEVKNNPKIKIPVIGNGDIHDGQSAGEKFEKYNVDGIMIGRATVGRPWIFKEIRYFLDTGKELPPLTVNEIVDLAKTHFRRSIDFKGIPRGIYEMRRHFSTYFRGLPHFKKTRIRLLTTLDVDEVYDILDEIAEKYGDEEV